MRKETQAQLQSYSNITLMAVFFMLFFGVAFLSLYIIAIATMLLVLYVMLQIRLESTRQFEQIKKLLEGKHGK
jgi:hypothetical protein